jgi:hypothetical protein
VFKGDINIGNLPVDFAQQMPYGKRIDFLNFPDRLI